MRPGFALLYADGWDLLFAGATSDPAELAWSLIAADFALLYLDRERKKRERSHSPAIPFGSRTPRDSYGLADAVAGCANAPSAPTPPLPGGLRPSGRGLKQARMPAGSTTTMTAAQFPRTCSQLGRAHRAAGGNLRTWGTPTCRNHRSDRRPQRSGRHDQPTAKLEPYMRHYMMVAGACCQRELRTTPEDT